MADDRLRDVTDSGFFGTEGTDGPEALDPAVTALVNRLRDEAQPGRDGLVRVLLGVQEAFGRVSWRVQELLADLYDLSPAQVAGVVSFYPELSLDRAPGWSAESADLARAERPAEPPCPPILRAGPVLSRCGVADPGDIDRAMDDGVYGALRRVLTELDPVTVVGFVKRSGLQERGGEGFPVGLKWALVADSEGAPRYVIGNGESGDPLSAVDRTLAELDPHTVIEGMAIAGVAVGAAEGRIVLPSSHRRAVESVERAIAAARRCGVLGRAILGSGFDFDLSVAQTAGVRMGGEETAVLNLLEGGRAVARTRPPFPAECGLRCRPTLVNALETLANIPRLLEPGAPDLRRTGRTKVVAVEAPGRLPVQLEIELGTTVGDLLDEVLPDGRRRVRAVHVGGIGGAMIDPARFDTAIDYGSIRSLGARLGAASVVVIGDGECPVKVSLRLVRLSARESCGTCPSCRIGTRVLGNLLELVDRGEATSEDLDRIEDLCRHIRLTSMCELGRGSVNPVLTALRHLRADVEDHLDGRGCAADR